ncbi:Hpt domain-containing protein [Rhizobium sp. CG4]|jgi:HPt (histidine-containing phosphotransfer) domain-containing protein|uniref:Hpt domain-containing protein n=1 Tax=Rhizobium/Agrobacterium group TaxID=227290 RepID=UPI0020346925|nr:Hpt domain-containing protein [Rhizobium sp. CG4]MCM2455028.1 Hpt domain-containing protein [Rhizobium sp. CG4]
MAAASMAFSMPDNFSSSFAANSKPVDLAHLAKQTMGDKDLEIEILQLFARNTRVILHELADADHAKIVALAHRLKGSADAVGAFRVSTAARDLESNPADSNLFAQVTSSVIEAENFILKLCRS